ncbi:MAG: RibD family protein [Phycisphaerae bacterium]|nr:RibD family protein [Phycisphaerae bacterium]
MLPYVIIHNGVSIDGRMDWLTVDLGVYYSLAKRFEEDATLVGANTLLQGEYPEEPADALEAPPPPGPDDARPLLVVPDSRGRFRHWSALAGTPYWRGSVALCSQTTPAEYRDYLRAHHVDCIVAGTDHVDLPDALGQLAARHGVKRVRVDSGGTLSGVLLRAGLVHEVSLLIHPQLVGGTSPRSCFLAADLENADGVLDARLLSVETHGQMVWLRYELAR